MYVYKLVGISVRIPQHLQLSCDEVRQIDTVLNHNVAAGRKIDPGLREPENTYEGNATHTSGGSKSHLEEEELKRAKSFEQRTTCLVPNCGKQEVWHRL